MKITFNPGSAVTLGEDAARKTIQIEQFGVLSVEQVEHLFKATNAVRIPRGNISGEFIFTAMTVSASRSAAVTHFITEAGRVNSQGTLLLIDEAGPSTVATMNNAICRSVVKAEIVGLSWWIRYTFGFTTVT